MSKLDDLQQRIVGKTRQAVGEILGDQALHDEGQAQAKRGQDVPVPRTTDDAPALPKPET